MDKEQQYLEYQNNFNKQIYSLVTPNSRVLDVGCNTGNLGLMLIKNKKCIVYGIDYSKNALKIAKKNLSLVKLHNLENYQLPFKKEKFDFIIFGDVLEHIKNPEIILHKYKSLLINGGSIIISVPNIANIKMRLRLLFGKWNYQQSGIMDKTHLRFFTKSSIIKIIKNHNYIIKEIKTITGFLTKFKKIKFLSFIPDLFCRLFPTLFSLQYVILAKKMDDQINQLPKIIAFHLPQFHSIPENDKWWGQGFTEWTNTKKAKPLFKGHYQPREPFNKNYYNLLNSKTRDWQASLAKKYGIYGFCYYHYWFKGKKLLEKPIEEILRLGKPNFPFCLSWANESWSRTWYGNKKEILINQDYGDKFDWVDHFNYLLPFFKDKRYIKVNNKPLFLIYQPSKIKYIDNMIVLWNKLAIENGFNGIHIVETLTAHQAKSISRLSEGTVFYEPGYTLYHSSFINKWLIKFKGEMNKLFKSKYFLNRISYDKIYKKIIRRKTTFTQKRKYYGGFVDWDNTSRKQYEAIIFNKVTPKKFEKFFKLLIKKSLNDNSEFIFITAWNEWAEGAYLEPDERYKFKYLQSIKNANNFIKKTF